MFDIVIVGAGLSGCILARRIAEECDKKVLIIEKRNHIGGDCYDYRDKSGILIHKYGPHIFRTDNKKVYDYLSRFTDWVDYQHKVLSYVDGLFYPMPINLDTVNMFFGTRYNSLNIMRCFNSMKKEIKEIKSVKDVIESQVGEVLYEKFFENYTEKQWGMKADILPKEIVARIPIRTNRDNRYFTHKYQCLPQNGYTELFKELTKHKNIKIMFNTEYKELKDFITASKIFYTGSIDEYYDFKYGKLPYRSVKFQLERLNVKWYQPVSVVNYPNNYDYTRITEYKHFYMEDLQQTIISKEYSCGEGDPSYPIPTKDNIALYNKYKKKAGKDDKKIKFIGRLGEYKYFSMDQIVENVLNLQI